MGTFMGHAVPGSGFMVYALWQLTCICRLYFNNCRRPSWKYQSMEYFTITVSNRRVPMESMIIIIATMVGIIGEACTVPPGYEHELIHAQHITMFSAFLLVGLIQLAHFFGCHMPPSMVRSSLLLALSVEGILFAFHLHGRNMLDIKVHMILVYVVLITVIMGVVELLRQDSLILSLLKTFLILLQGVWFWQVAFILYPPPGFPAWNPKSHEQLMIIPLILSGDCLLCLVLMGVIWCAVASRNHALCGRNADASDASRRRLTLELLDDKEDRYSLLNHMNEENGDIEIP